MTCQDVLDAPPRMFAEVSACSLHSQLRPAKRRVHRRGAFPKPARTDRPRGKRPSQCQDRHPCTGPRRGRRAPGLDPARKAEGSVPRHDPETSTARERRPERCRQRRHEGLTGPNQRRNTKGGAAYRQRRTPLPRRDHQNHAAKSSLKGPACRRIPADLNRRRHTRIAFSGRCRPEPVSRSNHSSVLVCSGNSK